MTSETTYWCDVCDATLITARSVLITDDNDVARIELDINDDGEAILVLEDAGGSMRGSVGLTQSGLPAIILGDAAGTTRFCISITDLESPDVVMYDASGKVRAGVYLSNGEPVFAMYDSEQQMCMRLQVRRAEAPVVMFQSDNENTLASLCHSDDGTGMVIENEAGDFIALADAV